MQAQMEVLLARWGRWAIKRDSGALGYSSVSPMFVDVRSSGHQSSVPLGCSDDDMVSVDAAVKRLPMVHRCVVMEEFQRGGSRREKAERLGIHHKSYTQFLNQSYEKISVDMQEQCAQNQRQFDSVNQCA